MRLTTFIFTYLLLFSIPTEVFAQATSPRRLQVSTSIGTRSTSTALNNLFGESVGRFERSLDLVHAEISFRKNDRLTIWARYSDGANPAAYVLAGIDRQLKSLYAGGKANFNQYTAALQYGYHTFGDSLYQDNVSVEQAYELKSGVITLLNTSVGIGNEDRFEWLVQGSLLFPVIEQLKIEPMLLLSKNGFETETRTHAGMRAHISLFEKGKVHLGMSREINAVASKAGTALLFTGTIPFMQWHQLNLTVQKNWTQQNRVVQNTLERANVNLDRTTLIAIGMTLGIGRQNYGAP
ncbi:MAG: hypothetical protein AB8G77_14695 [Rhodothermales bacterium]